MAVVSVDKNHQDLTMSMTSEFDAPIERVWQVWADPRRLERWWGPPTYPATVVEHSLVPGERVTYFMTGPEGDTHHGWWRIIAVDPPHLLQFEDGFADEEGRVNPDLPTITIRVELTSPAPDRTRMTVVTHFTSLEAMQELEAMGMEEGARQAAEQIDDVLAGIATP